MYRESSLRRSDFLFDNGEGFSIIHFDECYGNSQRDKHFIF